MDFSTHTLIDTSTHSLTSPPTMSVHFPEYCLPNDACLFDTNGRYRDETQLALIQPLIDKDLSEPYSIFTYRYFISQWPQLCHLAMSPADECLGVVVCKQERSKRDVDTGYIAMLAVRHDCRSKGLGSALVTTAITCMKDNGCEQVMLEAEVTNLAALTLYDNLGFIRDKRLEKYYLNGNDAFRLRLRLRPVPLPSNLRY